MAWAGALSFSSPCNAGHATGFPVRILPRSALRQCLFWRLLEGKQHFVRGFGRSQDCTEMRMSVRRVASYHLKRWAGVEPRPDDPPH